TDNHVTRLPIVGSSDADIAPVYLYWSPDSQWLAYFDTGDNILHLVSADGTERHTSGNGFFGADLLWSADSQYFGSLKVPEWQPVVNSSSTAFSVIVAPRRDRLVSVDFDSAVFTLTIKTPGSPDLVKYTYPLPSIVGHDFRQEIGLPGNGVTWSRDEHYVAA